jgi:hypothetical protein
MAIAELTYKEAAEETEARQRPDESAEPDRSHTAAVMDTDKNS